MHQGILFTGSSGLAGAALTSALLAEGVEVVHLDLRGQARGYVRDRAEAQEVVR